MSVNEQNETNGVMDEEEIRLLAAFGIFLALVKKYVTRGKNSNKVFSRRIQELCYEAARMLDE